MEDPALMTISSSVPNFIDRTGNCIFKEINPKRDEEYKMWEEKSHALQSRMPKYNNRKTQC